MGEQMAGRARRLSTGRMCTTLAMGARATRGDGDGDGDGDLAYEVEG